LSFTFGYKDSRIEVGIINECGLTIWTYP